MLNAVLVVNIFFIFIRNINIVMSVMVIADMVTVTQNWVHYPPQQCLIIKSRMFFLLSIFYQYLFSVQMAIYSKISNKVTL